MVLDFTAKVYTVVVPQRQSLSPFMVELIRDVLQESVMWH